MVPSTLDRPERQSKFLGRGAIYGSVVAVLLYVLLAYGWYMAVEKPLVFVIVAMPLLPLFVLCREEAQQVDRALSHKNYALYNLAYGLARFEEWSRVRPRNGSRSIIDVLDQTIESDSMRYSMLAHAFAFWNDVPEGAEELRKVRDEIAGSQVVAEFSAEWKQFVADILAYYSAVYEADLEAALGHIDGNLEVDSDHIVGWRNATVLAVLVLQGRDEEARALGERMMEACKDSSDLEYVEEHVARVLSIRQKPLPENR
jgi:hypothetical protein